MDALSKKVKPKNVNRFRKRVYHLIHEYNITNVIKLGLLSRNDVRKSGISFVDVSEPNIQERRDNIHGYNLHDYVSTYFNPRNAMLYRLQKENKKIAIIEFKTDFLREISPDNIILSDRNASAYDAFLIKLSQVKSLSFLNEKLIFSKNWYDFNTHIYNNEVKKIMQSECLVKGYLSPKWITRIIVKDENQKVRIQEMLEEDIEIYVDYFKDFFFSV